MDQRISEVWGVQVRKVWGAFYSAEVLRLFLASPPPEVHAMQTFTPCLVDASCQ